MSSPCRIFPDTQRHLLLQGTMPRQALSSFDLRTAMRISKDLGRTSAVTHVSEVVLPTDTISVSHTSIHQPRPTTPNCYTAKHFSPSLFEARGVERNKRWGMGAKWGSKQRRRVVSSVRSNGERVKMCGSRRLTRDDGAHRRRHSADGGVCCRSYNRCGCSGAHKGG